MPDSRPEYVTCIKHTHADRKGKSWCGRPAEGFLFVSIDHAAYARTQRIRLLVCPDCAKNVTERLNSDD